jgi:hypothetical protein
MSIANKNEFYLLMLIAVSSFGESLRRVLPHRPGGGDFNLHTSCAVDWEFSAVPPELHKPDLVFSLQYRQNHCKGSAASLARLDPYPAMMVLDD